MIIVNVAMGYSGSYLFHWKEEKEEHGISMWVPSAVAYKVFCRSPYWDKIRDSWKARPTKSTRSQKTVELLDTPNGLLRGLIDSLVEEMENENTRQT